MTDWGRKLDDAIKPGRTRIPLNDQQGFSVTSCLLHFLCPGYLKSFINALHHALSHLWISPYNSSFSWSSLLSHLFFFFCLIKKYIYSSLTSNHILSPCFYPSFSSQSKHFSFHKSFPSLLFHRWSLVAWVSFSIEHFSYYMVIFHKLYPPLDSGMRLMKPMYSWCCYNHHPVFLYLA